MIFGIWQFTNFQTNKSTIERTKKNPNGIQMVWFVTTQAVAKWSRQAFETALGSARQLFEVSPVLQHGVVVEAGNEERSGDGRWLLFTIRRGRVAGGFAAACLLDHDVADCGHAVVLFVELSNRLEDVFPQALLQVPLLVLEQWKKRLLSMSIEQKDIQRLQIWIAPSCQIWVYTGGQHRIFTGTLAPGRQIWLPRFLKSRHSRGSQLQRSTSGTVLSWSFVV